MDSGWYSYRNVEIVKNNFQFDNSKKQKQK
jgi:hypothetical protein